MPSPVSAAPVMTCALVGGDGDGNLPLVLLLRPPPPALLPLMRLTREFGTVRASGIMRPASVATSLTAAASSCHEATTRSTAPLAVAIGASTAKTPAWTLRCATFRMAAPVEESLSCSLRRQLLTITT
ncbi:hypothetical protein MUK42_23322 [Musa troglodytarum]|uniref:Uncharacterized protein n=1 Tax=Musa troglodytarum TaxID=320322 RepID=A0A9E7GAX8_9LILI|nr:hypothetical protein MUK42_23322 [Musa troglodytarum]